MRLPLILIVAVALSIRLWWSAPFGDAPTWSDPDGYLWYARQLADGTRGWHWTRTAVEYAEFFKAPLYQVALSALTAFPATFPMPASGLVLHAVLNTITVLLLFVVGRELHSRRAGLIAAIIYACWVPNILLTSSFWQEQFYVPLVVGGLALLGRAVRTNGLSDWIAAGGVLGIAALTRSSIAYFVVPAAAAWILMERGHRASLARAGLLLGAFAMVTLPYSAFISKQAGQTIFIENIGFFALKRVPPTVPGLHVETFMADPSRAPTMGEALRFFAAEFSRDPTRFALRRLDTLRLTLKPMGGTLLPNLHADTKAGARWMKAGVHAAVDVPLIGAVILAPLGAVLSRSPRFGALLLLWVVQHLLMLAMTSWAGARFRAPVEPALIALAAVVLSWHWRRANVWAYATASLVSAAAAALVAASLPSTVSARANYGVTALPIAHEVPVSFTGSAGIHVHAASRMLTLSLARADAGRPDPVEVMVWIDGREADRFVIAGNGRQRRRYPLRAAGIVYLELDARVTGQPVAMLLGIE